MTVYFANAEPIDLAAIEVMGVNVKVGDSPIGYFGTGLKFAIATLLRYGATITLARPDGLVLFRAVPEEIRGKIFGRVVMFPEGALPRPMGFTTDLGRNWELWQAFRELESNCRDEQGVSTAGDAPPEGTWGTCFAIESPAFEQIWRQRDNIFLPASRPPIWTSPEVDIYERQPTDSQDSVFYRGVLAGKLSEPGVFLYNMKLESALTEDRTLQSIWNVAYYATRAFGFMRDERVLEKVLFAPKGVWEHDALVNWQSFSGRSPEFDAFVREHRGASGLNQAALHDWASRQSAGAADWPAAEVTKPMRACGERAFAILRRLDVKLGWEDFTVTESLGEGIYGLAKGGKIFIAKRSFDIGGARFLASTLYEEYIHAKLGLGDETRSMQNFLFEKLFALVDAEPTVAAEPQLVREVAAEGGMNAAMRLAGIIADKIGASDDEIPF